MTLNQLEYFHRAATLQHFNLAAESLHISQPSLSRSMNALEQELGVTLFEKKGRNIVLTKAGQAFLIYVEDILNEIHHAKTKMSEIANNGGHIDIGYVSPLAHKYLPETIRAFMQNEDNNNVEFSFYKGYTKHLIEGLKEHRYDIIFCANVPKEDSIQLVPIIEQEMVVIMPKGHPLCNVEYVDHTDFNRFPILGYDNTSGLGIGTKEYFESYSIKDISFEFPDESSIASFVSQNFGIALVADVYEIHRDDIVIKKLVPEERFTHKIYMGYEKNVYMIPAVQRLIQFISSIK